MARSDFDSAWKDALDAYFPQCMALLWPALYDRIDWRRAPVFRDKELQALLRSRRRGRRHVDKLVSVQLVGGQQALVLIHVEVQAGRDDDFAPRMFAYHVRLREKHPQEPIVSLAVLTQRAAERGVADGAIVYAYDYWGCGLTFTFPVVCLEDWRQRWEELAALAPSNPFAVVILAQLEVNAARDAAQRLVRKTELVRHLYLWGFNRDNVIQLFRIIDAMVGLPKALESVFGDTVTQIEGENNVAYVTSVERLIIKRERAQAMEEGLLRGERQGMQKGAVEVLAALLTRKFGVLPDWARARMSQADETTLNRWAVQILDAERIEDVFV